MGTFLTEASNAGGVGKNRDSDPISCSIGCCERFDRQVQYTPPRRTMAYSLLMAGDDDKLYDNLNVTPKTTEQHLSVLSSQFEA